MSLPGSTIEQLRECLGKIHDDARKVEQDIDTLVKLNQNQKRKIEELELENNILRRRVESLEADRK